MARRRPNQRLIDGELAMEHVIHNILGNKAAHPLLDVLKFAEFSTFETIWACYESVFIESIIGRSHPLSVGIR